MFESSSDAHMTLLPPDWNFSNGNPATLKLFGVKTEAEFNKLSPADLSPKFQPDGMPSAEKAKIEIEKALKDGKNSFDWVHKKYKGEEFFARVLLVKITLDGKDILQSRVRNVSDEVTAIKKLKEKIEEAQKLNQLMVGRELKMIELKNALRQAQGKKFDNPISSDNRFQSGIDLEEDVIQAIEKDYESEVKDSQLKNEQKSKIIDRLQILLKDSKKHEQLLKGLV